MHRIYYLLAVLGFALGANAQRTASTSEAEAVARLLGRTNARAARTSASFKSLPSAQRTVSPALSGMHQAAPDGSESRSLTISGSLLYRYSWTASGTPQYGI